MNDISRPFLSPLSHDAFVYLWHSQSKESLLWRMLFSLGVSRREGIKIKEASTKAYNISGL